MHELLEREDKWDVDDEFRAAALHDLIDDGEIDRTTVHLESAYYDTADHDLQSHGVVLRRRDGDDDTGWQLKVPDVRRSHRDPYLARRCAALRAGRAADRASAGQGVGQRGDDPDRAHPLSDPRTRAAARSAPRSPTTRSTRRWSTGCLHGGRSRSSSDLMPGRCPGRLAKRLSKAGARPSRYPSKLAHAIGAAETPDVDGARRGPHHICGRPDRRHLRRRYGPAARTGSDPRHPGGDPQAAQHDSRVRQAARPVGGPTTSTRSSSGSPVFSARFATAKCNAVASARSSPTGRRSSCSDPSTNRINTDLHSEQLRARTAVSEAMDSQRYLDILATLQRWRGGVAPHQRAHRQEAGQAGEPGRTQGRPTTRRRSQSRR